MVVAASIAFLLTGCVASNQQPDSSTPVARPGPTESSQGVATPTAAKVSETPTVTSSPAERTFTRADLKSDPCPLLTANLTFPVNGGEWRSEPVPDPVGSVEWATFCTNATSVPMVSVQFIYHDSKSGATLEPKDLPDSWSCPDTTGEQFCSYDTGTGTGASVTFGRFRLFITVGDSSSASQVKELAEELEEPVRDAS
jgi:hypothetical protein